MYKKQLPALIVALFLFANNLFAQPSGNEKYPSLLWEITGNGLSKPSYLFGTMHVSSKLVFHLSDSFYNAIKKVDAVALELNPDVWQGQMVRLNKLKNNYSEFVQLGGNDYLTESSFRIKNYVKELKSALQTEPAIVNNLLYRSYKTKEDFEEDTFLDLYIFQTGRKLGKKAAGVENYYEAEKLILEAYADMAKEKKKKTADVDQEFMNTYVEKIQDAYRKGDLDLMDSLDNLLGQSPAFREKFLFRRNEIQANSIDSIIRNTSLFAGVGAAHLPGNRGVIELLRKKGYKLRPVKMADRNGLQKNSIDGLHVPVVFQKRQSEDEFYSVDVPGDLYKVQRDYSDLDRRQYADMSNGSYYLVTRIKTHAAFLNQTEQEVLKKIDSVLYENIPGKILSKKQLTRNGYNGYDISSKTRRGDQQRYQIFVTPFEIIIFKMSGKENYVAGKEAEQFFSSIKLKEKENKPFYFQPAQGGFGIMLPQIPDQYLNDADGENRWEYEAVDKATGDAYLLFKKSIYNINFLEEDSFDLKLLEESFRSPEYFDKQLSRKLTSLNGSPVLKVKEKLKNGSVINARFLINGPHYYVLAQRVSGNKQDDYLNSFSFKPYNYQPSKLYTDTFLRVAVQTPVIPDIDAGMRSLIEQTIEATANGNNFNGYISYWPKPRNGLFKSDSTGEMVAVQLQELPKYYFIKDSAKFWQEEVSSLFNKQDMYPAGKISHIHEKDFSGVQFALRDTGSSRVVNHLLLLRNNFMYRVSYITDTTDSQTGFAKIFFANFKPTENGIPKNIYETKLPMFFTDLFSTDSAVHKKAQQSISNLNYGINGMPLVIDAIKRLSVTDKDYYNTKSTLISELGYIKDSSSDILVSHLKTIYEKAADTSLFQNEVIKALSRLKTTASYLQLKEFFLQDPPIFENSYDYNTIFSNLQDSLKLSALLFPEIMQLASLDDYKGRIMDLLVNLVDSGYAKKGMYDNYFPSIYIDAVVVLKKQKIKDEKQVQEESKLQENDEPARIDDYSNTSTELYNYSILLMPYYDEHKNVSNFFTRLLQSKDDNVKLNTVVLMLRSGKPVADSIILALAAKDRLSSTLFYNLEKINKTDRFPVQYKTQQHITRSYLIGQSDYDKLDSVAYLSKQLVSVKGKKGWVYFYKYRTKKTDQWRIGISGLQPEDTNKVSSDYTVLSMTDVKIKDKEPLEEQLQIQLKKLLFGFHKSAKKFFDDNESYDEVKAIEEYED